MTNPPFEWPMPKYDAPPKDYMHALGIVSLNYNSYEHGMYAIFRHHLEKNKVPRAFSEFVFGEFNGQQQAEAVKKAFFSYEKDPKVIENIEHLLLHFAWCFETRNLLLHSHQNFHSGLSEASGLVSLAKRSGASYSKLNFMYLSLEHLRAIADHMHSGYSFLLDMFAWLSFRDGLLPPMTNAAMWALYEHASLPSKPPIPRKIKLRDHPVTREA